MLLILGGGAVLRIRSREGERGGSRCFVRLRRLQCGVGVEEKRRGAATGIPPVEAQGRESSQSAAPIADGRRRLSETRIGELCSRFLSSRQMGCCAKAQACKGSYKSKGFFFSKKVQ